ncbi:MAG: Hsp20/alpha crystallin family protein [Propionibacteriaceae bacterium]|jgi:HSP20 family protein|nr:Hsp20/alpha crystallin family protein [Propionibacteriaceae bacterium]
MARTYDPFRDLFIDTTASTALAAMPMDLFKEGDEYVAEIDMPGVDPKTIDVDIDDRTLTIRGERSNKLGDKGKWMVHERPSGTFARQLNLGRTVALDKIDANYSDGVLTVHIPMAEEAKPRKVSVHHMDDHREIEGKVEEAPARKTAAKK